MDSNPPSNINIAVPRRTVRRIGYTVMALVALAIVVVVVVFAAQAVTSKDSLADGVKSNEYQAVFLTSNEVYFGKLTFPSGGSYVYLRHAFRLTQQASNKSGQPLQRTLVKVPNDLHSPEDLMMINRSQILYVENLNPSGKAAQLMQSTP